MSVVLKQRQFDTIPEVMNMLFRTQQQQQQQQRWWWKAL